MKFTNKELLNQRDEQYEDPAIRKTGAKDGRHSIKYNTFDSVEDNDGSEIGDESETDDGSDFSFEDDDDSGVGDGDNDSLDAADDDDDDDDDDDNDSLVDDDNTGMENDMDKSSYEGHPGDDVSTKEQTKLVTVEEGMLMTHF